MNVKLVTAVILIISAQACCGQGNLNVDYGNGDYEEKSTAYETQQGQYATVKTNAEASCLSKQAYTLTLEVSHTTKYICQDITAKLRELAVPEADVVELEAEISENGASINAATRNIMTTTENLITHLETVNNDIVNTQTNLQTDQILLDNYVMILNQTYSSAKSIISLSLEVVAKDIELLIVGLTGPLVDEINALILEAKTVLAQEEERMDLTKLWMDIAIVELNLALDVLVANPTTSAP